MGRKSPATPSINFGYATLHVKRFVPRALVKEHPSTMVDRGRTPKYGIMFSASHDVN
jgi:hypothetical protein